MPYHRIDAKLARLFTLGLDADMPEKLAEWKAHLAEGRVTDEMRTVFYGMGYISSMRDPRIKAPELGAAEPDIDIAPGAESKPVELREPAEPGRYDEGGPGKFDTVREAKGAPPRAKG